MKKLIALSIAFALVATSAFAQITMGGWGRGVFVPLIMNGDNLSAGTSVNWGGVPSLGWTIGGSSENFGFDIAFTAGTTDIFVPNPASAWDEDAEPALEDVLYQGAFFDGTAKIWWSPIEMFKLTIGRGRESALRGGFEGSNFTSYITGKPMDPDAIFKRFRFDGGTLSSGDAVGYGAHIALTPMPGLYVGASVSTGNDHADVGIKAEKIYESIHVAAGYQIPDIGHIRVGYYGLDNDWLIGNKSIQAAFALTAVPGLGFDIGFTYSLDKPDVAAGWNEVAAASVPASERTNGMMIAFGYDISMIENVNIWGIFQMKMLGKNEGTDYTSEDGLFINFQVNPSYALSDSMSVGVDIGFAFQGEQKVTYLNTDYKTDSQMFLGFAPYLQLAYANGTFKGGVGIRPPLNEGEKLILTVPLMLTYSF